MGTLSEELFRVGLVSEKQFREQQAEEELEGERSRNSQLSQLKSSWKREGCDELDQCPSMGKFKHLAKEILSKDPSQIRIIIQKAHRFKANKKFIWFFYQVKDGLEKVPEGKREQLLNRAFRKSGSNLDIPD